MKTLFSKYGREWLNPLDSSDTGNIMYTVSCNAYRQEALLTSECDADFSFSDCTRKITLDFSYYSHESYVERLRKVDSIINHLYDFRDGLVQARNVCDFSGDKNE